MYIFNNGYYKQNRILLIGAGLWPKSPASLKICIRSVLIIVALSLFLPQCQYLRTFSCTINDFVLMAVFQLSILVICLKLQLFGFTADEVQYAIDRIEEDWVILSETSAIDVAHVYAMRGYLASRVYIIFMFAAGSAFFLLPLQPVVLDFLIPLNQSRVRQPAVNVDYSIYGIPGDEHYYLTLMHGVLIGLVAGLVLTSVDSFVGIGVGHCCGLFRATGLILQELNDECSVLKQNSIIRQAIQIHKRAIALADLIESTFTMLAGVVVGGAMTLITITALLALYQMDNQTELVRYLTLTVGEIINLFLWSLPGQELFNHSSDLFETIYLSNWTFLTVRDKKLILLMLMRSSRPSYLTAGKFYFLNLENFKNVLQASMSYFTVFWSLR